jgi:CBS domain-containing protein
MPSDKIRDEEVEQRTEVLEGDEGEPEVGRHADVGRQILMTRLSELEPKPAVSLAADATVEKAAEAMRKKKVDAVLVKKGRKLVGIFTHTDLVNRCFGVRSFGKLKLEKVMTKDPETLAPGDSVAYALNKMSVGRFRHVPVVNEKGLPTGMVSSRQIIDFIVELCPEEILNLPPEPKFAIPRTQDGE